MRSVKVVQIFILTDTEFWLGSPDWMKFYSWLSPKLSDYGCCTWLTIHAWPVIQEKSECIIHFVVIINGHR